MRKLILFLFKSVAYGLALAFILLWLLPALKNVPLPALQQNNNEVLPSPISYNHAVRRAAPAVVNVYTRSTLVDPRALRPRTIARQELGSGVLMSAKGYILTNYHVVYGADYI